MAVYAVRLMALDCGGMPLLDEVRRTLAEGEVTIIVKASVQKKRGRKEADRSPLNRQCTIGKCCVARGYPFEYHEISRIYEW